jgi:hypothetical protein
MAREEIDLCVCCGQPIDKKQSSFQALKGIRKIVINNCHGGFGLSPQAVNEYKEKAGITDPDFYDREIARDDPYLIQVIENIGPKKASSGLADLAIVNIPADVEWQIEEYDGLEWVAEKHRIWEAK